jgi:glycosyltransferase involved in cell wall biosynthesis
VSGLRFLMLTTFYPPLSFGGDAVGIQRLSRGLVRRGHHVTVMHDADAYQVLSPRPATGVREDDADGAIEVVRLQSRMPALSVLLTQQLGRPVLQQRAIREHIAKGHYDVITFHNTSLIGGPGLFQYAKDSVSLYMAHEHWLVCPTHVLWRHGRELCTGRQCVRCALSYKRPPQLWRSTGYLEREIEQIDAVIAMSEFSREKHREFGFTRDMEVLPYFLPDPTEPGFPAPEGAPPHERPYFFFAGRLELIKGLDDVIPVFRDFQGADLLIAGDGSHGDALRRTAAGMPNVRFLGRLTPEELARYYRHAIALVVPSVCYETFGIVLIESFREGVPVIARRLGPFPEIVEASGGGELFSTADELRSALHRLQSDPVLRRTRAEAGYRGYLERWSERVVVPKYLDIVRRAAVRRGHERVEQHLSMVEVA